jgi:hypothetical protein
MAETAREFSIAFLPSETRILSCLNVCGFRRQMSLEFKRLRLLVLSPGGAEWNSQGC